MRDLKYNEKTKILKTTIEGATSDGDGKEFYSKVSFVATRKGLVKVMEWNWKINGGRIFYTELSTVFNGWKYSATLNESNLSAMQVKWLATRFVNTIQN